MRFRVVHIGKRWERALPHFDVRVCPYCAALVWKEHGQAKHLRDHEEMWAFFQMLVDRLGIDEDTLENWEWTAEVNDGDLAIDIDGEGKSEVPKGFNYERAKELRARRRMRRDDS